MLRAIAVTSILLTFAFPAGAQKAPLREPDVVYVPTPQEVVEAMLQVARVGKGVGIDINPERIKEANANLRKAGVGNKVLR